MSNNDSKRGDQRDDDEGKPTTAARDDNAHELCPHDDAPQFTPPDGGYGWVVVIAACVAQIWIVGFLKSYSLIYVAILTAYPESSAYHASWVQAMLGTIGLIMAPVVGTMCTRYTTRKVTALGAVLCFVGLFASAFATSVTHLILTTGVLTGIGLGMITTPGVLIVNMYFDKKRSLASAICVSGNSIGAFMMPPLVQYLLTEYQLRGTFIIMAALQLHIIAAACLYRPSEDHARVQARQLRKEQRNIRSGVTEDYSNNSNSTFIKKIRNILSKKEYEPPGDEVSREVSMYRCIPLTSSVTNMDDFRRCSLLSLNQKCINKTETGTTNESNAHAELQRLLSSHTDTHSEINTKNDSVEMQNSSECNVDVKSTENTSLRKVASLRLFTAAKIEEANLANHIDGNNSIGPLKVNFIVGDVSAEPESREQESSVSLVENVEKITSSKLKHIENKSIFSFVWTTLAKIFDPKVLRNPFMICMSVSSCFLSMGAPHFIFYVHAHYGSINMDSRDVTKLLSITALVDMAGRLSIGFIADTRIIPMSILYLFCLLLAGVCAICVPLVTSVAGVGIVLSGLGFGIGGWVVLVPTLLARTLGTENLPASYGFIRMIMGIMNFVSPQVTGAIIDSTGGYSAAYYLMGVCIAIAGFVQWPFPTKRRDIASEDQELGRSAKTNAE